MNDKGNILVELEKIYQSNPQSRYLEVDSKQYARYFDAVSYQKPRFGLWYKGKQVVIETI